MVSALRRVCIALFLVLAASAVAHAAPASHRFVTANGRFELDGKPFQIISGGKPTDTFLDMRAYGKGQVWVNGHALGRYWRIGPQGGLYLPGVWLHPGRNEVVLLDLDGGAVPPLSGVDHALIDEPIRAERVELTPAELWDIQYSMYIQEARVCRFRNGGTA